MRGFLSKALVIITVIGVLLIAGLFVRSIVNDRIANRDQASRSIADSLAESQTLAGMVLVLNYTEQYADHMLDSDEKETGRREQKTVHSQALFFPDSLNLNATMNSDPRYRGIFHINTYLLSGKLAGSLQMPELGSLPHTKPGSSITLDSARLILAVSDPRGIRKLNLTVDGRPMTINGGTGLAHHSSGIQADIPDIAQKLGKRTQFELSLQLAGTSTFSLVPLARDTSAELMSGWQHPSFGGRFLPVSRQISASGFHAQWNISALASNAQQAWSSDRHLGEAGTPDAFSVAMIDPVDIYSMSDRASKYAGMFIILTLGAFLLFELLRNLRLHPMNYLLIGAALLLFFVILLSLSEHIGFGLAYLAAASACVLLIGFYSASLLRSHWLAAGFTTGLGLLYGALYVILLSEQNALLMGSLLLFGLLASVMIGTRKVNWHSLTRQGEAPASEPAQ